MKIIIHAPNWIGDAVLSLPSIESLKSHFPQARVWIAAQSWVSDLFSAKEGIEGVIPLPSGKQIKNLWASAQMLKPKKFDAGCLLPNSFGSALLFYLARIPERWGYSRDGRAYLLTKRIPAPENEVPLHQVNYYLNLMAGLGLRTVHPEIKISLSSQEKALARRELDVRGLDPAKRIVILSPGAAYGPAKRWPVAKFAELATLFQKKLGFQILITGSADEAGLAESLSALMEKKPFVLAGQTTLRQLLSIISHAALFISNDSGPMHLANALRVPVIAIFGPTDPSITGPCQEPAIVLQKKAACWPCYYRSCPYDHRCLEGISTEEVFAASLRYCQ